ncbi:ribonuclease HI [Vibrio phage vB_VcorM_GR11A]|nr:ribonuclease HI [Vibrio phage vB_VcorM_GR11A]
MGFGKIKEGCKFNVTSPKPEFFPSLRRKKFTSAPASTPIIIYTDGSCDAKDRCGGWGVSRWLLNPLTKATVLISESSGWETDTTVSLMELGAAITALKGIKDTNRPVILYTDSQYVQRGVEDYLAGWTRKGGYGSRGEVKNIALWRQMVELLNKIHVEFRWVKGHSGVKENEYVDNLAGYGRAHALQQNGMADKIHADYRDITQKQIIKMRNLNFKDMT